MSSMETPSTRPKFKGVSPIIFVDVLCPFIIYQLVVRFFPTLPAASALVIAALCPAISLANSLARRQLPDVLGLVVVTAIIVAIIAVLLGANADLIFPIITGTSGLIILLSLRLPKPLAFYVGRELTTHNNAQWIADFNDLWHNPRAPFEFRLMTLVWGLSLTLEFILQLLLFLVLPRSVFHTVSYLLKTGVFVALLIWSTVYAHRSQERGAAIV